MTDLDGVSADRETGVRNGDRVIQRAAGEVVHTVLRRGTGREDQVRTRGRNQVARPVGGGGPVAIGAGAGPGVGQADDGQDNVVAITADITDLVIDDARGEHRTLGKAIERAGDGVAGVVVNQLERVADLRNITRDRDQRGAGEIDGSGHGQLIVVRARRRAVDVRVERRAGGERHVAARVQNPAAANGPGIHRARIGCRNPPGDGARTSEGATVERRRAGDRPGDHQGAGVNHRGVGVSVRAGELQRAGAGFGQSMGVAAIIDDAGDVKRLARGDIDSRVGGQGDRRTDRVVAGTEDDPFAGDADATDREPAVGGRDATAEFQRGAIRDRDGAGAERTIVRDGRDAFVDVHAAVEGISVGEVVSPRPDLGDGVAVDAVGDLADVIELSGVHGNRRIAFEGHHPDRRGRPGRHANGPDASLARATDIERFRSQRNAATQFQGRSARHGCARRGRTQGVGIGDGQDTGIHARGAIEGVAADEFQHATRTSLDDPGACAADDGRDLQIRATDTAVGGAESTVRATEIQIARDHGRLRRSQRRDIAIERQRPGAAVDRRAFQVEAADRVVFVVEIEIRRFGQGHQASVGQLVVGQQFDGRPVGHGQVAAGGGLARRFVQLEHSGVDFRLAGISVRRCAGELQGAGAVLRDACRGASDRRVDGQINGVGAVRHGNDGDRGQGEVTGDRRGSDARVGRCQRAGEAERAGAGLGG